MIIGALFKILHLQYGNEILTVAMIVEAIVFFVSGFERPANEYHWEEVFPVLKSKNPLDRPDFSSGGAGNGEGQVIIGGSGGHLGGGTIVLGDLSGAQSGGGTLTGNARAAAQNAELGMAAMGLNVSEEDTKSLANSIQKLGDAAEQISRMADLTDATKTYIEQISSVTANLERFNVVTNSLSEVSDSLVHSCEMIAGSKNEHSEKQTIGYVQQMEQLNQSLSGLNEFYSVHLSGLRSQMDTIQQINAGLSRIRDMYDNSVMDSTAFRNENERMAQLLAQLNQVYGRLLQAMTVNMPGGATMYPPQQPPYQGGYLP